ncbi:hypothetical protein CHS0354_032311 [Potamilus streckersoni]|uniref:Beta-1,4-galactosyltransferase n=1 Tax=Potamilus streckersoni TaxID=2493646 RepID=A0AAE0RQ54_9BIVA|nr:hypothetical protein CHS0354_032311 [Potamilus streckersoni]
MFKKKDVVPLLTLVLLIFIIIVTLSQILVVHHKSTRNNKSPDMSKLQKEFHEIEKTIEMMLETNVVPPEQYQDVLKGSIYASRIEAIIMESINSGLVHKQKIVSVNQSKHVIYTDMDDRKSRSLQYFLSNLKTNIQRKSALYLGGSLGVYQYTTESVDGENYSLNSQKDLSTNSSLQLCPETPKLVGKISFASKQVISVQDVLFENNDILPGGKYRPSECIARHRVAVIIPFRNRYQHLVILLKILLPVLKRQQLDFRIFVVEQYGNDTFNKGRVMNAGFMEAWKLEDFRCFVFHDVDLIPEDDRNMYSCPVYPRHMSVAINEMSYK